MTHAARQRGAQMVTILIVDDNAEVRRMIRMVIEGIVDEIHECSNGAEALNAYVCFHPDWVLMDIEMPDVDGLTACRAITRVWPDAKVCIVSQYNDDELRAAALNASACGYVLKDNLLDLRGILGGQPRPA